MNILSRNVMQKKISTKNGVWTNKCFIIVRIKGLGMENYRKFINRETGHGRPVRSVHVFIGMLV